MNRKAAPPAVGSGLASGRERRQIGRVSFGYDFPAIRGIQAGREYYISMCPLRLVPKLFTFDNEELPPELRAQRALNKGRLPEITRYVLDNPDDYCFSAITASIDSDVQFEPLDEDGLLGKLSIPMGAKLIINDGQHRRAAVQRALEENPDLGDESIAVVFFLDLGLERCQQMFADLNRHVVRPSKSIGVLYDHRDDKAVLARLMVLGSDFFKPLVELEGSSLSPRSKRLFTLSAIYNANTALLDRLEIEDRDEARKLAVAWWEAVADHVPEWRLVHQHKMSAGDVRKQFIHTHSTTLVALGRTGNSLLHADSDPKVWRAKLEPLRTLRWGRTEEVWQGRTVINGQVKKGDQNVRLTANAIKTHLGLPLGPEERRAEEQFTPPRGDRR
ncbi:DNA sulfur modification protein DndB [Alienimonas californiensis]|uniref:DNA sulfur modification protein DndB n=1 Tax=Alienimonas californiensis TaxID=2527989 RepID=UPI001A984CBA|nr:DNA sulfur modification protein DndB [Alienimonas californiensis]